MDTTKKYIKMSEKAKDIRKFHYPEKGDFYWYAISSKIKIITEDNLGKNFNYCIWLPRQDQLQGMVKDKNWIKTQVAFYDFIFETAMEICAKCFKGLCLQEALAGFKDGGLTYEKSIEAIGKTWNSFEQAWLAFVMKEKYNKTWNGEDWV